MALSPGLSHARRAVLPSSACMLCFTYALGDWLSNNHVMALMWGSLAVLLLWPFAALPFIPIGLDALALRGFFTVFFTGISSLFLFGFAPALIDSWYYGRWVWPFLQMVLYNAFGASGGGAHLYGIESWTFYPKNLFLNLGFIPLLFLGTILFPPPKLTQSRLQVAKYLVAPTLLHFVLFQSMPHKEERFLFVIYPAFCAGASLFLATRLPRLLVYLVLLASFFLSVSRNIALARFTAPSTVLHNGMAKLIIDSHDLEMTLCYGREWYRFPSSFFLPPGMRVAFTRSGFRGLLP